MPSAPREHRLMVDVFSTLRCLRPNPTSLCGRPLFRASFYTHMTDTLITVQDDLSPAENMPMADVPNGFIELGLAPELVKAVADLGYTQPTAVQLRAIPLALPTAGGSKDGKNKGLSLIHI